jgi:hypothetical protein
VAVVVKSWMCWGLGWAEMKPREEHWFKERREIVANINFISYTVMTMQRTETEDRDWPPEKLRSAFVLLFPKGAS